MSTLTHEAPPPAEPKTRSRWGLGVGLVAVVAAIVVAAIAFFPRNDPAPALELSLAGGDSLASCLAFDVATLAGMSPAFEGTATAVDGERVTLRVDHWFAGGSGEEVHLISTAGMTALIGGIDFEVGRQYLITAADGQVNFCGYSGPSTPEYRASFEEAFAA